MQLDGLFAVSITLMLAEKTSLANAVIGGGALLALRHVGEALAALFLEIWEINLAR